jgi:peptidyl-tRNA hydrolase
MEELSDMTPILYILMRNDLDSLNSGKAMAQASHASNTFVQHFHAYMQRQQTAPESAQTQKIRTAFYEWENSTTQGFGTVLVLEAGIKVIEQVVAAFKTAEYLAGVVHDPTYPLLDGKVVHYIPLDTCAYVFVPDKPSDTFSSYILKNIPLHR